MNKPRTKLDKKQRLELILIFSIITFAIFVISLLCVSALTYLVVRTGALQIVEKDLPGGGRLILFMAIASAIFGLLIVTASAKSLLKPVNKLIDKMNHLASGDYATRIDFGKPFGNSTVMRTISDSFNTMAQELQNTEVLRSDFINNFSHEFKTPIVSIAGFAKLLKRGNLTEAQKIEYIGIIEEEAMRLSYMATNVLNLTRVESQTILTDVSTFNLSEQIRSCILLLEDKWAKKNLDMYIDFGEHMISANEEFLKHGWINLLDNAIKFSPEYGILAIKINEDEEQLSVSISNNGDTIPPELQNKIFNKFYQADKSHASKGNGIGLAIVKHVTELHGGTISVMSENNLTTFTIKLPKTQ
jgi:signal transduction histidine kinase